jgi:hypothetical protein
MPLPSVLITDFVKKAISYMYDKAKLHCKKRLAVFLFPAGMSLTNSPWPEIIKVFPPRESLISDIPAGDGKTANIFFTV